MRALVVEAGGRICALPLSDVIETMRPLPLAALADMPVFLRGMAVIRGRPMPVVDLATLLGTLPVPSARQRFLTVFCGDRQVALAIDAVIGIHTLDETPSPLPPLLADSGDFIDHLATLDQALLLVLRAGRLLPPELAERLGDVGVEPQPA